MATGKQISRIELIPPYGGTLVDLTNRILEVGFGSGDLLKQILAARLCDYVAGIDRSPALSAGSNRALTISALQRA